jgi:hypothetical protein
MAKYLARANAARLELVLQRLHKTSGGVSETEAKELMVRPTCRPLPSVVVTMVTSVANAPHYADKRGRPNAKLAELETKGATGQL